jgi:hypothetical protein
MRSFLIALTMMASVVSKADTPVKDIVTPAVLQSFQTSFSNAREVSWTAVGSDMYKASFTFNGQYITAFYNTEGSLVALTRNISSNQLPIKLQAALQTSESGWISDLFEISNDEGTTYYVTVENADHKVVLKSTDNTSWSVYQKTEKI